MQDKQQKSFEKTKQQKEENIAKKKKIPKLKFVFLDQKKIEEITELYTQSFLKMNDLWRKMGVKYQQVFSVNRGKIVACYKAGMLCAMIDQKTQQLAAVAPNIDLVDYIDLKSMPHDCLFLKTLGKYGAELQKEYFDSMRPTLKRGFAVYNVAAAILPKYMKQGISRKFWATGIIYMRTMGYKYLYCRASNRVTTKLFTSFGGQVLKTVKISQPGIKEQFLQLLVLDLNKINFESLSKFYPKADQNEQIEIHAQKL